MSLDKIAGLLKEKDDFLLLGHVRPDGDTLGCMKALGYILKSLNKKFVYALPGEIPLKYSFLFENDHVCQYNEINRKYNVLIALDVADVSRLEAEKSLKDLADLIINIDHHAENTRFGDINYIDDSLCATGIAIYDLACKMNIQPQGDLGRGIYTAIVTDTGNYRWSSTDARAHEVTAALYSCGLDAYDIIDKLENSKTASSVTLLGHALASLEMNPAQNIAWVTISAGVMEKTNAKRHEIEGISEIVRAIHTVEAALLFLEKDDGVKISFRSKKFLNVNLIANNFGGGGHNRASGCFVKGSLADVKARVLKKVFEVLAQSSLGCDNALKSESNDTVESSE
jgi:phosphoesterase RecJ-like protein